MGVQLLFEMSCQSVGPGYQKLHILKSLTYFADAEKDPPPHLLAPLDWEEIKSFFEREVPQRG